MMAFTFEILRAIRIQLREMFSIERFRLYFCILILDPLITSDQFDAEPVRSSTDRD